MDPRELAESARARAYDDPAWFFSSILRAPLLAWQLEGVEAILDVRRLADGIPTRVNHEGKARITVRSCHGTGKTHWLAQTMHLWNFITPGTMIACTAPKEAQLRTRLWPRYRQLLRTAVDLYRRGIDVRMTRVVCWGDDDWGAVAETASDPENLAGYHDTPMLFLVDEASGQRLDSMFPVIEGALTTPGSVCVEIGNPTRSSGEFWSHHNKPNVSHLYYRMHVTPDDAPTLISRAWLETMATKYGADSPIYKVRCLGEFADQEENQLIPYTWLTEAREREPWDDGSLPRTVVTVDVAAGGDDFSVVEVSRFYSSFTYKIRQDKYNFKAREASRRIAQEAVRAFDSAGASGEKGDFIVVDMMGVGNGAFNYLSDWGYPVIGYAGGTRSDNPDRWRNRRVQSYWAFHDDLQAGRIVYDDNFVDAEDEWDEYFDQVCAIRTRPGLERVEDLESKEMLVKRTGKSPDRADASAMSYVTELPDVAYSGEQAIEAIGEMSSAQADW